MKHIIAVIGLAGILTFPASAQYRVVRGQVYPNNAPDWTAIRDKMEVVDVQGRLLICKTFTERDVEGRSGGVGNNSISPVYKHVKTYLTSFIITNYPSVNSFKRGDIINPPVLVMGVRNPTVSSAQTVYSRDVDTTGNSSTTQRGSVRQQVSQVGSSSATVATSFNAGGTIYDYGTVYVPPPVQLTPEQAEAAKANAAKSTDSSAATTFKFHMQRALEGNAGSQFRVGQLLLDGKGCTRDPERAKTWLQKSAEQGNQDAKELLNTL